MKPAGPTRVADMVFDFSFAGLPPARARAPTGVPFGISTFKTLPAWSLLQNSALQPGLASCAATTLACCRACNSVPIVIDINRNPLSLCRTFHP